MTDEWQSRLLQVISISEEGLNFGGFHGNSLSQINTRKALYTNKLYSLIANP